MLSGDSKARAEAGLARAEELLRTRDASGALAAYDRAEHLGAEADRSAGGRWQARMLDGELEGAWRESDAIRARGAVDPHRFWDGRSLEGRRVIVRCLHGFGDTIQMLRYLPGLLTMTAGVILEVPPRLLDLVQALPLARDSRLEVLTWEQTERLRVVEWDAQIEVTELAYIFRTRTNDLPIATAYVRLPESEVRRAAEKMGLSERLRVGVVWTAGSWNQERAVDPALLRPLLECRAEFWSLVKRSHHQEEVDAEIEAKLHDAETVGEGVLPMAAVIANLDLVLTTDTLAAHLAGAMGKPVWVLLCHAADWRWMSDPERSPWYPSMRLFRQSAAGAWGPVLCAVERALAAEIAGRGV